MMGKTLSGAIIEGLRLECRPQRFLRAFFGNVEGLSISTGQYSSSFGKIVEFYKTLPLTFFAPQREHIPMGRISPNSTRLGQ
jgi:hypothetical protein